MANVIKLKKGLNLNLTGKAATSVSPQKASAVYGLVPESFVGVKPKVVVKVGDVVKAGDALFVDKLHPEVKFTSPVSGTVKDVVRGDRRKVLNIQVEADASVQYAQLGKLDPSTATGEQVLSHLLESGLFAYFVQRPYAVTANPEVKPKAIFVSAFSDMPLAADFEMALKGNEADWQTGIDALSKLGAVFVGAKPGASAAIMQAKNCTVTVFDGPCPAGNVGVQINHLNPINKGEHVWTLGAEEVIWVGRLMNRGVADFTRTIAVAGGEIKSPCYQKVVVGQPIGDIVSGQLKHAEDVRIIDGNPFVGTHVSESGFLSAHATEVCAIPEGSHADEAFGWIMPRLNDFSTSRSYFTWLQPKSKTYNLDARVKGGERHMIMSEEYDNVFPMDIYPEQLVKAIICGDIDRMEQLGIYEVAPEDFAVCEFEDSSKLELQRIVREGLDMLRKENDD